MQGLATKIPVFSSTKFAEIHLPPGPHVEVPERVGRWVAFQFSNPSSNHRRQPYVEDGYLAPEDALLEIGPCDSE